MAIVDQLQASIKSPKGNHVQHSGAICCKLGKFCCDQSGLIMLLRAN